MGLLCLAVGLLLGGQAGPADRVVRAEKFVIADRQGVDRAEIGLYEQDGVRSVRLAFLDMRQKPALQLGVLDDGRPFILMSDQQGKSLLSMHVDQNGAPGISLFAKEGKYARVEITAERDAASLRLRERNGNDGISFVNLAEGGSSVMMANSEVGDQRIHLLERVEILLRRNEAAQLRILNRHGEELFKAP